MGGEKPCKFRSQFEHENMGVLLRIEINIHISMCTLLYLLPYTCLFVISTCSGSMH